MGPLAWAGVIIVAALLLYEHSIVSPDDLSKMNAAFFTMNGVISIVFFVFVAADIPTRKPSWVSQRMELGQREYVSERGESLDHALVARTLLSVLCALQGLATPAIDCNRTHATNPTWTRHARFHVVWQSVTITLRAGVEPVLIWSRSLSHVDGFYLACLLASLSPLGFLFALATRTRYGGMLSGPNGIPPVRIVRRSSTLSIDMNLAAVVSALLSLVIIIVIYRT